MIPDTWDIILETWYSIPYTRDTCHLYPILDIWLFISDTQYLIRDIWYSIYAIDISYSISDTHYQILDIWYSISDTRYKLFDICYSILDIWHLDTCSLKLWYMLPVTCQMLMDIWYLQIVLHDTKACYYLQKDCFLSLL